MNDHEILLQILSRFDNLETRFDNLETRFDNLETRFDNLETRFDNLESRFDKLESRFDNLETRFDKLESKVDNLETKIDNLEIRVDGIDTRTRRLEVLLENDIPKQIRLIAEQHGDLVARANEVSDYPETKGRVSTLENVVSSHSDDIQALQKAAGT